MGLVVLNDHGATIATLALGAVKEPRSPSTEPTEAFTQEVTFVAVFTEVVSSVILPAKVIAPEMGVARAPEAKAQSTATMLRILRAKRMLREKII